MRGQYLRFCRRTTCRLSRNRFLLGPSSFCSLVQAFVRDWITPLVRTYACDPHAMLPLACCSTPRPRRTTALCSTLLPLLPCRFPFISRMPAIFPQIGAIFSGGDFSNLTFSINGSTFFYGDFINVLIYFILVCLVVYFFVGEPGGAEPSEQMLGAWDGRRALLEPPGRDRRPAAAAQPAHAKACCAAVGTHPDHTQHTHTPQWCP